MKKRNYIEFWVGNETFTNYKDAFAYFMKHRFEESNGCLFGFMDWGGFLPLVYMKEGKIHGYFKDKILRENSNNQ